MATPEAKIKAKVNRALKQLHEEPGFKVYRFCPVQMGYGATTLDYLICVNGQFIGLETKRKGKKMTPRQEQTAEDITDAGGLVFVVDGDERLAKTMEQIRKQCQ